MVGYCNEKGYLHYPVYIFYQNVTGHMASSDMQDDIRLTVVGASEIGRSLLSPVFAGCPQCDCRFSAGWN